MTPHLRGYVRAYVDRALPPAMLHLYDRHLVCCAMCRSAADQERRIVAALRADTTGVPNSLRSALMGLAEHPPAEQPGSSAPRVPLPPIGFRMPQPASHAPVPTVRPTAPALHRSPVRAAVVASIAAGASVAAAWGLAISPLPGARLPSARVPAGVASFGSTTFGATTVGATSLPSARLGEGSNGSSGTVTSGFVARASLPYWVVSVRSSNRLADSGPVRVSTLGSAQSAP
jgi:hypothetical protein